MFCAMSSLENNIGKRQERERERESTLLQKNKDLSTSRLFHKSVPDDKHGNTQYVRQQRETDRERERCSVVYLCSTRVQGNRCLCLSGTRGEEKQCSVYLQLEITENSLFLDWQGQKQRH